MKAITMLTLTLLCAGCAGDATNPPVVIVKSDFCDIAEKVQWSTQDTRPSIDGMRREAAKIDQRCSRTRGEPKAKG